MESLRERLQHTLGDSYRIERELGGGGMSKVFLAEEVALHRRVVIKVLSTELAAEISGERFRREIQLAARLQHPHVVPVLQSGETDGVPFYTMPFVEGESLRARLDKHGAYIELWKNADPELQPAVTQARRRVAELERSRG